MARGNQWWTHGDLRRESEGGLKGKQEGRMVQGPHGEVQRGAELVDQQVEKI